MADIGRKQNIEQNQVRLLLADDAGTLSWGEPVSTPGSYVRLRAELDLVIAFSACPQDILPINGVTGKTTEAHFVIE